MGRAESPAPRTRVRVFGCNLKIIHISKYRLLNTANTRTGKIKRQNRPEVMSLPGHPFSAVLAHPHGMAETATPGKNKPFAPGRYLIAVGLYFSARTVDCQPHILGAKRFPPTV
jgi:hypothetical protein